MLSMRRQLRIAAFVDHRAHAATAAAGGVILHGGKGALQQNVSAATASEGGGNPPTGQRTQCLRNELDRDNTDHDAGRAVQGPAYAGTRTLPRSRSAFPMTDTEEKLIATAAISGLSSKPKNGYSTPAAIGIPRLL